MQQVRDNDTYATQMLPYLERRFGKLEQSHSVLKDRFVDIHCLTVGACLPACWIYYR